MTHPGHVVLVTDIPDHARSYADALVAHGFTVDVAGTGERGLISMRRQVPACAVIDERLPDMSGWELCRAVKSLRRLSSVPLIVLTADISALHAEHSLQAGCHAWLARPTVADDLMRTIRHVLAQQEPEPSSSEEALVGMFECPACASARIRATLRLSPMQYYKCLQCGFYWRVEVL